MYFSLFFQNEQAFDQVFTDACFKSYIFKFRAKVETYNVSEMKVIFLQWRKKVFFILNLFFKLIYVEVYVPKCLYRSCPKIMHIFIEECFLKKNSNLQVYNMENYNWVLMEIFEIHRCVYLRKNKLSIFLTYRMKADWKLSQWTQAP